MLEFVNEAHAGLTYRPSSVVDYVTTTHAKFLSMHNEKLAEDRKRAEENDMSAVDKHRSMRAAAAGVSASKAAAGSLGSKVTVTKETRIVRADGSSETIASEQSTSSTYSPRLLKSSLPNQVCLPLLKTLHWHDQGGATCVINWKCVQTSEPITEYEVSMACDIDMTQNDTEALEGCYPACKEYRIIALTESTIYHITEPMLAAGTHHIRVRGRNIYGFGAYSEPLIARITNRTKEQAALKEIADEKRRQRQQDGIDQLKRIWYGQCKHMHNPVKSLQAIHRSYQACVELSCNEIDPDLMKSIALEITDLIEQAKRIHRMKFVSIILYREVSIEVCVEVAVVVDITRHASIALVILHTNITV
jgi:hypothetical protein